MAADEKRRSTSYLTLLLDNSASCPLSLPGGGFINAVVADEVVAAISVEYT
jgi:hypothetical protein